MFIHEQKIIALILVTNATPKTPADRSAIGMRDCVCERVCTISVHNELRAALEIFKVNIINDGK